MQATEMFCVSKYHYATDTSRTICVNGGGGGMNWCFLSTWLPFRERSKSESLALNCTLDLLECFSVRYQGLNAYRSFVFIFTLFDVWVHAVGMLFIYGCWRSSFLIIRESRTFFSYFLSWFCVSFLPSACFYFFSWFWFLSFFCSDFKLSSLYPSFLISF
jgi:hypothetical protein